MNLPNYNYMLLFLCCYGGFFTELKAQETPEQEMLRSIEIPVNTIVPAKSGQADSMSSSYYYLDNQPYESSGSPFANLTGKIPGLYVSEIEGAPGSSPLFLTRGLNSWIFGTDPVFMLDGIPLTSITDIGFFDIKSIEVLHDPFRLSFFGGQGSNGAILIETREAVPGRNRISFSSTFGIQELDGNYELLNPDQLIDYYTRLNAIYDSEGRDMSIYWGNAFISDSLIDLSNPRNNTWQDDIFNRALKQTYSFNFSGGSDNTDFFLSASYLKNDGIVRSSFNERVNILLNLDHQISPKLKIGSGLYLTRQTRRIAPTPNDEPDNNAILTSLIYPIILPDKDETGRFFINPMDPQLNNPNAVLAGNQDYYRRNSAIAQFYLRYNFLKNLSFKLKGAGNLSLDSRDYFLSTVHTYQGRESGGYGIQNGMENNLYLISAKLDSRLSFAGNPLGIAGEVENLRGKYAWNHAWGFGFPTDEVKLLSGAGTALSQSGANTYTRMVYRAQLNYLIASRYLLEANVRTENSSRISDGNEYGLFYGVRGSWMISEESFFPSGSLISNLKLSFTYGISGNDGGNKIGNGYALFVNDSVSALNPDERYTDIEYPGAGYDTRNIQTGTWEKSAGTGISLFAGLFKERIGLEANYYSSRISDLILPDYNSAGIQYSNQGEMKNTGFEWILTARPLENQKFGWISRFTLATTKNEVISTDDSQTQYFSGYNAKSNTILKGYTAYSFWGYKVEGIFMDQDEIDGAPIQAGATPGDLRYKNLNSDGIIDENDKTILGDPFPDLIIGFDNTFSLGRFELSVFIQGATGLDRLNMNKLQTQSSSTFGNQSIESAQLPNEREMIPDVSLNENNLLISDRFVEDASYLKIRNLTLGYNLPEGILKSLNISNAKIYFSVRNLLTITGYSGYDPELSNFGFLGIDYGTYPVPRYFGGGINLNF